MQSTPKKGTSNFAFRSNLNTPSTQSNVNVNPNANVLSSMPAGSSSSSSMFPASTFQLQQQPHPQQQQQQQQHLASTNAFHLNPQQQHQQRQQQQQLQLPQSIAQNALASRSSSVTTPSPNPLSLQPLPLNTAPIHHKGGYGGGALNNNGMAGGGREGGAGNGGLKRNPSFGGNVSNHSNSVVGTQGGGGRNGGGSVQGTESDLVNIFSQYTQGQAIGTEIFASAVRAISEKLDRSKDNESQQAIRISKLEGEVERCHNECEEADGILECMVLWSQSSHIKLAHLGKHRDNILHLLRAVAVRQDKNVGMLNALQTKALSQSGQFAELKAKYQELITVYEESLTIHKESLAIHKEKEEAWDGELLLEKEKAKVSDGKVKVLEGDILEKTKAFERELLEKSTALLLLQQGKADLEANVASHMETLQAERLREVQTFNEQVSLKDAALELARKQSEEKSSELNEKVLDLSSQLASTASSLEASSSYSVLLEGQLAERNRAFDDLTASSSTMQKENFAMQKENFGLLKDLETSNLRCDNLESSLSNERLTVAEVKSDKDERIQELAEQLSISKEESRKFEEQSRKSEEKAEQLSKELLKSAEAMESLKTATAAELAESNLRCDKGEEFAKILQGTLLEIKSSAANSEGLERQLQETRAGFDTLKDKCQSFQSERDSLLVTNQSLNVENAKWKNDYDLLQNKSSEKELELKGQMEASNKDKEAIRLSGLQELQECRNLIENIKFQTNHQLNEAEKDKKQLKDQLDACRKELQDEKFRNATFNDESQPSRRVRDNSTTRMLLSKDEFLADASAPSKYSSTSKSSKSKRPVEPSVSSNKSNQRSKIAATDKTLGNLSHSNSFDLFEPPF